MRRIVGKAISWCLNEEIQDAAGPLQVSAGMKGGAEAAIHAMKDIYELENTDAVILVDAANAFNRLNRYAALHNMQYLCPAFSMVLINTYHSASRLFIAGAGEIESAEGTTQGCPLAMPFYGISVRPIIDFLKQTVPETYQVWLADDATGAGSLRKLREWWITVAKEGEKYGYFVKPSKSWLILKDEGRKEEAENLFMDCPINITTSGKRHLGATIGTQEFKTSYIDEKVTAWCKRLEKLSEIAKSEPHVAYAAYIHGEQHRYTYFARTIADISLNLQPVDEIIENKFIPALFGRNLTDKERELLSVPIREGGLGLRNIHQQSSLNYHTSRKITSPLINRIKEQSDFLPPQELIDEARTTTMLRVKQLESINISNIKNKQTTEQQRTLQENSEPGASSWLGAIPNTQQRLHFTKNEFQDALRLRYNMDIRNLPPKCPCGKSYTVTHALNCKLGGFMNSRHNNIRNFECKLLKEVCRDVECEPPLQKIPENRLNDFRATAITAEDARLDIRARGFWRDGQNAFFDVRVTNVNCDSQKNDRISNILRKHEQEKKRSYNKRVMEIEHGSLTPLIFTTSGVMGHECEKYHKSLSEKLSEKKGEKYQDVMRYLRVKLSYLSVRSTLLCLRGSRSTFKNYESGEDFDFAFNLGEMGL
jgi:hypothetical protein